MFQHSTGHNKNKQPERQADANGKQEIEIHDTEFSVPRCLSKIINNAWVSRSVSHWVSSTIPRMLSVLLLLIVTMYQVTLMFASVI